jgi:hypothetical protein
VTSISRVATAVEGGQIIFRLADAMQSSLVGPALVSLRINGDAGALGAWTPTCADTAADSNLLYRNLALQDVFADTSKELWEFDEWQSSSQAAIQPLRTCTPDYRRRLAADMPPTWGDHRAAQIVADAILRLDSSTQSSGTPSIVDLPVLRNAPVPSLCEHPEGVLVDGSLPGIDVSAGGVWMTDMVALGDVNDDGRQDAAVVFDCSQGGVAWPQHIVLYGEGPRVVGQIDLGLAAGDGQRAVVKSITYVDGGFNVEWTATREGDVAAGPTLDISARVTADGSGAQLSSVQEHDERALLEALVDAARRNDVNAIANMYTPEHLAELRNGTGSVFPEDMPFYAPDDAMEFVCGGELDDGARNLGPTPERWCFANAAGQLYLELTRAGWGDWRISLTDVV